MTRCQLAVTVVDKNIDFDTIALSAARRSLFMPTYEYACKACNNSFSLILTMSDHDTKRVTCPKCKSRKVEQQIRSFSAVTSKKS